MTNPNLYQDRQARLCRGLADAGLDGVVLNPGPSLTHLTGLNFHLMERPVVALLERSGQLSLALPELETAKLDGLAYPVQTVTYGENPDTWPQIYRQAFGNLPGGARLGVEPTRLRFLELELLRAALPQAVFTPAGRPLVDIRLCKDDAEVAAMRRAVQIAEQALLATLPKIRTGMSEHELAGELTMQLLQHGSSSELPFPPIVSAGPNSANPHATPSARPLSPGDLLVIDWGAAYDGYISDLTRTFAVGEIEAEYARIVEIVEAANAAGRAAARPGAPAAAVDQAARAVIEQAGYGPYFTHRTGHGIGMEAHEEPYMRGDNQQLLAPGMAFTVEPGIYLLGRNGVRIEDNLVITRQGAETLSSLPRELRVVGG